MELHDLTEEQKAKVLACKTPEELLELAKAEGYDLNDEELEAISGGKGKAGWTDPATCPKYVC